jgi:hypothetical protein
MERQVIFAEHQQLTTADANNLGEFPRESFDHIIEDLGPGFKFTGFSAAISATSIVTIGAGRLFSSDGKVYYNDDAGGTELDFISNLPVTAKKICAVVAWGSEFDSDTEPRTFITDAQTRATEARPTSTHSLRHANIQAIVGVEGADPQRPTVASNYLVVAWVTLNTSGVESVVAEETNRALSIEDLGTEIDTLNAWRLLFGQQLDQLAQLLADLAARIGNMAPMDVLLRLIVDVTRLKEKEQLPDAYSAWASDYFLDDTQSDTQDVDYHARIEEGLRFPHYADQYAYLALQNPIDSSVTLTNTTFMLPKFYEVRRLANVATAQKVAVKIPYFYTYVTSYYDYHWETIRYQYHETVAYKTIFQETGPKEVAISQFANQAFSYHRHYPVRWRVRWGAPYYWSSRINFWWDRNYDPVYWTFWRGVADSSWVILSGPPYNVMPTPGLWAWRYKWVRTKWWWWDYVADYHYWDRITTSHSVNGSVIGQTWLNAQDGWCTGLNLFFTRKGAAGNVTVLLCETWENGQPNPNAVIAVSAELPPSAITIWPYSTRIVFPPTLLQQGKRYAFIMLTQGNHYVATTEQNQLTHGTMFYSTDAAWFQGFGDMSRDIAFEMIFAEFEESRVEVQLQPATLTGGIAAIDINADAQIPEGTTLTFEVQIDGEWVALNDPGPDATEPALVGLPALLNMRAVFQGSTSLMPSLSIGNASQIYTWRVNSDFVHISEERTMPQSVTIETCIVTLRIENWRGSPYHTCTCTLLPGPGFSAPETADTTAEEVAPDDPNAIIRTLTFSGLSSLSSYKIKITGNTDNVLTPFHVAERVDVGIST